MRVDIVAYDRHGQLVLIVEIKKKLGTSSQWATMLKRNILAHGALPDARFFLLALPDRFYLWKNAGSWSGLVQPMLEIDPQPFLLPYYQKAGVTPEQIGGRGFELIVTSWLADLLRSEVLPDRAKNGQKWLVESGLFEAISGGRLEHEVAL